MKCNRVPYIEMVHESIWMRGGVYVYVRINSINAHIIEICLYRIQSLSIYLLYFVYMMI